MNIKALKRKWHKDLIRDDLREMQMDEIKRILESLDYDGPAEIFVGCINGIRGLLGGPNAFHYGRGVEITESLVKYRRPKGKPLRVLIDPTNGGKEKLRDAGYISTGKIGTVGDTDRNWEHAYYVAVAEVLIWDIDILLISGGMRGVTVMNNSAAPGIAGGYSQTNYSLSLMGANAEGMTEGKGKPIFSAEAYRHDPKTLEKRTVTQEFYDDIGLGSGTIQKQSDQTAEPPVSMKNHEKKAIESQIGPSGKLDDFNDPEIVEEQDISES